MRTVARKGTGDDSLLVASERHEDVDLLIRPDHLCPRPTRYPRRELVGEGLGDGEREPSRHLLAARRLAGDVEVVAAGVVDAPHVEAGLGGSRPEGGGLLARRHQLLMEPDLAGRGGPAADLDPPAPIDDGEV